MVAFWSSVALMTGRYHGAPVPKHAGLPVNWAGDEGVPDGLSDLLRRMIGDIDVHMKKEEIVLFPAIRRGGGPDIENPIAAMRADHDDHDREVARIRRLTCDLTLPESACSSWATLYTGIAEFIDDLTEHMRLENDVLFAQFNKAA